MRFTDDRLEADYERSIVEGDRRRLRFALVAGAALWVMSAVLGPPLLGIDRVLVALAAAVIVVMNAISWLLISRGPSLLRQRFLLLVINITSAINIVVVTVASDTFVVVGAAALLLNFIFIFPQRVALPIAMTDGVVHGGIYAAAVLRGGAAPVLVFNLFLLVSAIALAVLATRLLEDAERSSFMQGRVVVQLQRRLDQLLHQYLSPDVAQTLMEDPAKAELGGEEVEVTVLFADLTGFTSFSERVRPEDAVTMLNNAFTAAVPKIFEHGGTIVQFSGDALMAIFNAPMRQADHPMRAARAALALQAATAAVRTDAATPRFRVGLTTGPALVGNVGSPELHNFTAIGDTTNLAARLQTFAPPGSIVAATSTVELLGDRADVRQLGEPELKGKAARVPVYELLGLRES